MLVKISCKYCNKEFIVQYANYYCKEHMWSDSIFVCIDCYNSKHIKCEKYGNDLTYHDGNKTSKWQKETGIMF